MPRLSGFVCVACAAACSSPGPDAGTTPTASSCLEVWTDATSTATYRRVTFDADTRIAKQQTSASSKFDDVQTLEWRYASEGRIITYIGVEQPFQHDYSYDDRDNVTDFRLSYPDHPDLMTPSPAATWMGTSYENTYDANDRLSASTQTPYGDGNAGMPAAQVVYTEDAAGRCVRIETTSGSQTRVEIRAYDDAGRLAHRETTAGDSTSTEDFTYDDAGRLISDTTTATNAPYVGQGTTVRTHTYLPDGSERVEIDDGLTDEANYRHMLVTRTARCLEIDAAIGAPADARCRVQ